MKKETNGFLFKDKVKINFTRLLLFALFSLFATSVHAQSYDDYLLNRRSGEDYAKYKARVKREKRTNIALSLIDGFLNETEKGKGKSNGKGKGKGNTSKTTKKPNITTKIYPVVQPEAVDLGLPSGTHWASMNLGASSPEQEGNYYAWGESKPKTQFTLSNYEHYDNKTKSLKGVALRQTDIAFTICDPAYVALKGNWRMPNTNHMVELMSLCEKKQEVVNNIACVRLTGPNGNSIVFPLTAEIDEGDALTKPGQFSIWISDVFSNTYYQELVSTASYRGVAVRPINTDPRLIEESKRKTKEREEAIRKQEIADELNKYTVDLGIGILWAKCNYSWAYKNGETVNPWESGSYESMSSIETNPMRINLPLSGYYGRVPTYNELKNLYEKCTWTETTENGVAGYKVTGPNNNSIFIPCAGMYYDNLKKHEGESCYLWSSTETPFGVKGLCVKKGKSKSVISSGTQRYAVRLVFVK